MDDNDDMGQVADTGTETPVGDEVLRPDVQAQVVPADPPGGHRRRTLLIGAVAVVALLVGAVAGYASGQPQMSDLRSQLAVAEGSAETASAQVEAVAEKQAATQVALDLCRSAAEQATSALDGWSSYLDSVQALYSAESSAAADKALAQMSKRYRAVVEATVPTDQALAACTKP